MKKQLNIEIKNKLKTKIILKNELRQALKILQMPLFELSSFLSKEIEKNPLLKEDVSHFLEKTQSKPLDIKYRCSFFEHLKMQAEHAFSSAEEKAIALKIIGNLNEKGFYEEEPAPLEEKVLKIIQTFDPIGVGAKNLQECLLIQLIDLGLKDDLSFKLISQHYELLLRHKIAKLKEEYSDEGLRRALIILKKLSFSPRGHFEKNQNHPLFSEIAISNEKGKWKIKLNCEELPKIEINPQYEKLKDDPELKNFHKEAKWLKNCLKNRKTILIGIAAFIIKEGFFLKGGPLSVKKLAAYLNLSLSTAYRAICNKWIDSPCGMIALSSIFKNSSRAVSLLKTLLQKEGKYLPDAKIAALMEKSGVKISRRAIAKYRKNLAILACRLRKNNLDRCSLDEKSFRLPLQKT